MFPEFPTFFRALWGHDPFPWQVLLAERLSTARRPDAVDLPTASGKTACLDLAVHALAAQADRPVGERTAARRIWFVVDRRIVVDEAFERAQLLAEKLENDPAPPIRAVADRLLAVRGLPSTECPLAVSRLRGGLLRDDRWARVPSQAAMITSTVDQIGSRLLFRSYGDSPLAAPVYAGLAGNDSLILLDEAHCAVPFLQTLRAIQRYRSTRWSEVPNPTAFHVVVLSATPPAASDGETLQVFPTPAQRSVALDHPVLQQRLRAAKPAALELVRDDVALAKRLAQAAATFAREGRHRVGVIVNRVGRAVEIARQLRTAALEDTAAGQSPAFEVELLTGRIRPFERDLLIGPGSPRHRVLRAVKPEAPKRPLILVATQCLEVGADFSFDALVTECASLDALRQRFGRLNRLGQPGDAPALILVAKPALDDGDPIYGDALKHTWEFLWSQATTVHAAKGKEVSVVDFGVNALTPRLPTGVELLPLLAPAPDAPILLPVHLDLLCQTAPHPHPDPDLAPFLHGKGRGQAEVRVVWRCDLDPRRPDDWPEIVSLCRPAAGEMLPVPLHRLRQWLRERASADPTGDLEGGGEETDEPPAAASVPHPFLLWRGREGSEVLTDARKIPPGAVVTIPAPRELAVAEALGQTLRSQGFGPDRLDLWELARESTGRAPALRLHRACLTPWLAQCPPLADLLDLAARDDWTIAELRDAIAAVRDWTPEDPGAEPLPDWLRRRFAAARAGEPLWLESPARSGLAPSARPTPPP